MKRAISFVLALALLITGIPLSVSAANHYGTDMIGSNINDQDYYSKAMVVNSYLSVRDNGNLMTVTYSNDHIEVAYYSPKYVLLKTISLQPELPLFGGFHETDDGFFILSGQENDAEDDTVEVYRVTKYNKSWVRQGSASLCGVNTTLPFRAGSARFDHNGQTLFVRTCHQMYTHYDGLRHQANLTFSVNTASMTVLKTQYTISSTTYGYVSHSFNQFIRYADGRLYAVDHGDAHPRSICLMEFAAGSYEGMVGGYTTWVKDLVKLPGGIGDNYTGVSVGGFEVTPDAYLVVGNSELDSVNRNVFVSVLTKGAAYANNYYLTNYTDKDASTPHLVKISDAYYMVMWTVGASVYYQVLNSQGQTHGKLRQMKGALSDCAPIVVDGKVRWYTYSSNDVTFYNIDANNLDKTTQKTVNNGHVYSYRGDSTHHWRKCTHCGKKVDIEKHQNTPETAYPGFDDAGNWVTVCSICGYVYKTQKITYSLKITSNGYEEEATPVLKVGSKTLKEGEDYHWGMTNWSQVYNSETGWQYIRINYSVFTSNLLYNSHKKTVLSLPFYATVSSIKTQTYTGKAIKPNVTVKVDGKTLKKDTDYTVSYKNNTKVGTATVTITGKNGYFGTIKKTFKIAKSISKAKVTGITTKTYTGKAITQSPKVVVDGKTLKRGTDYTLSYKNNVKTGKATVTITGKGKYTGTTKKTFVIRPQKVTVSKFTSTAKKKAKVTWKKVSGASGYQVVYSTSKKFSSKKTITLSSSYSARTLTGLKSGKTYYVKVRAYKVINGKRYYSDYSTVKKIRVK